MEAEEMYIGQKVKPLQRTLRSGVFPAEHSLVWRVACSLGQPFLYVSRIQMETAIGVPLVMLQVIDPLEPAIRDPDGDWFQDVDLVAYVPKEVHKG